MENSDNKNENVETKYLHNMQKNQFLKVKNSLSELEKNFIELKVRELKDREAKIEMEIEELLFKSIIVSIDDMGKLEQKQMKNVRPIKNTWYDWLINYIRDPIRKSVGGFKDKFVSLFKTNTPKQAVYGRGKKQKQSEEKIINSIRNLLY